MTDPIPELIVRDQQEPECRLVTLQVEMWVASPEPAVGVFTTAGTCQGRLWRHFVIQSHEVKGRAGLSKVSRLAAR